MPRILSCTKSHEYFIFFCQISESAIAMLMGWYFSSQNGTDQVKYFDFYELTFLLGAGLRF